MTTVSARAEAALQAALARLLNATPEHTDGALTITNLAREARVSRATANRATKVADLLREEAARRTNTKHDTPGALRDRIRHLEAELAERRTTDNAEHRRLRQAVHALAQHVQALSLDNDALREALARQGTIHALADLGTSWPVGRPL